MKQPKKTYSWKRDYGDHCETDDSVLWIGGKPTDHCVSQASGVFYAYIYGKEEGIFDTRKEAKDFIIGRLYL